MSGVSELEAFLHELGKLPTIQMSGYEVMQLNQFRASKKGKVL